MKSKEIDFCVLGELRRDARQSLVSISEKTGIPASTVFKVVRRLEEKGIVKRYSSLVDYSRLGFGVNALMSLKADDRDALKDFLMREPCVNNMAKISGEYDFLVEVVFEGMAGMEDFLDRLTGFSGLRKGMHYITEELKKECFEPPAKGFAEVAQNVTGRSRKVFGKR